MTMCPRSEDAGRRLIIGVIALAAAATLVPSLAHAQAGNAAASLRAGKGYIVTPVFSVEEDEKLLALFQGLRVADVTDGMDAVGLQNVGLMDPEVRPLWKDTQTFAHRSADCTTRSSGTRRVMTAGPRTAWRRGIVQG
jgi:hypothetical protein